MNDIQLRELNVLKKIVEICKSHNINYFAIGGTCIGAVRHKGFIPWDDDIDIAMPRKDFNKFLKYAVKELPKDYKIVEGNNSKSHRFSFVKIHDSKATFMERYAIGCPDIVTGPFVDIMPIDGLSNKSFFRFIQIFLYRTFVGMNDRIRFVPLIQFKNVKYGKLKFLSRKILSSLFKHNFFYRKISVLGKKENFDNSNYCIFTWRAKDLPKQRLIFKKSFFENVIEVPFENMYINIPQKFDEYLKQDFGEYMIPPSNPQTHHDVFIIDLNNPSEYYSSKQIEQ